MSNSTEGAIAKAPSVSESPHEAPYYNFVPQTAPSPEVGTSLPKLSKPETSFSISWLGIVGILTAFLVLATIAITYLWYKRNLYKKALQEQRNFYMQNAASQIREDWSDDEEQNRTNCVKSKRGNHTTTAITSGEKIIEQDIPVYTRSDQSTKTNIIPGSFRDKHMCFDSHHQGEVFYTGEEGSQMGVRYSREELGNIEILTQVSTPKKRKAESDTTSLLGTLNRSHTIAASPTKEMEKLRNRRWTLRTFSLPAYHRKRESVVTTWGVKEGSAKVEKLQSAKVMMISPLTPHPSNSLLVSPSLGNNKLFTPWSSKPSRLSNANIHNPTFIVPPSTPPPPLPLPVTLDCEEKSLKELRRDMKQAESKWTIANYFPAQAPPPPLPVPLGILSDVNNNNNNNNLPSFRDLVQSVVPPPPRAPPPPPPPPRRSVTLPPNLLFANGSEGRKEPPPPPPPPPLSSPTLNSSRKFTPPPSPPLSSPPLNSSRKFVTPPPSPPVSPPPLLGDGVKLISTPPASPPPPPLPVGAPGGATRPKLTPLTLPGRPDLVESFEFRNEQRLSKRHQKMRPLHWDKLKPDSRTVWDNISNSMELDEEMIENLFGVSSRATASSGQRFAPSTKPASEKNEILDPRKAHNIAIQLRARGLSRVEVCDALIEGDGLGQETLEVLVKMSPTEEEVTKFQEYRGDSTLLGPSDRFILGILQIPSAFERLDALLYKASFKEELQHILDTITSLEMACKELKGSRTFTKLLEAVLKTGNRLNMGTFRGDAKAFKLDTLLKLADVKGVDGKTTLLHFVIQEIIKAEGARAARLAGFYDITTPNSTRSSTCTTPNSSSSPNSSSPLSHFARTMEAELERCQFNDDSYKDDFRKIGMDVVKGIPNELDHVRKAGALDILALRLAVTRLHSGLEDMKMTLEKLGTVSSNEIVIESTGDVFREKMVAFVKDAETEVSVVQSDLELVLASVKDISIYFYGEADTAKSSGTQPLKVFVVMREFLAMLEQACKDVMKTTSAAASLSSSRRSSLTLQLAK